MPDDKRQAGAAEAVAVPGAFHPDGVNTPAFLSGRVLGFWNAKLWLQRVVLLVCAALLTALIAIQVFTRYVLGISHVPESHLLRHACSRSAPVSGQSSRSWL
jgi:hypothetical protein